MSPGAAETTWFVVGRERRDDFMERRLRLVLSTIDTPHVLGFARVDSDIASLTTKAMKRGHRRFAAVGDDRTAHAVLNALMVEEWVTPPTLAILPLGSGSEFSRTFALPRRLEEAAALLSTSDIYRSDIGVIEGEFGKRFFLNAVGMGVAGAAARLVSRLPRRLGSYRYRSGVWLTLPWFPPAPVAANLGERTIATEAVGVVVANGQFCGGGLNIAPQAAVMDGALDAVVFKGPRRHVFSVMPRLAHGLHLRHPAVARGRLVEGAISVPEDWPITADGAPVGHGSLEVRVLPAAIDFKI